MIWRAPTSIEIEQLAASCVTFDPYLRLGYSAATITAYLTRPDPALDRYAIDMDGALAGVLCLRRPWLRGPLVEMLALLSPAQGQGRGGLILDRCKAEAGGNLWATVSDFHQPARRFYARQGFEEICHLPSLIRPDHSEILLRWRQTGR